MSNWRTQVFALRAAQRGRRRRQWQLPLPLSLKPPGVSEMNFQA